MNKILLLIVSALLLSYTVSYTQYDRPHDCYDMESMSSTELHAAITMINGLSDDLAFRNSYTHQLDSTIFKAVIDTPDLFVELEKTIVLFESETIERRLEYFWSAALQDSFYSYTVFNYNDNGQPTSIRGYRWDGNRDNIDDARPFAYEITFEYAAAGLLVMTTLRDSLHQSIDRNRIEAQYYYDAKGRLDSLHEFNLYSSDDDTIFHSGRIKYLYGTNGTVISELTESYSYPDRIKARSELTRRYHWNSDKLKSEKRLLEWEKEYTYDDLDRVQKVRTIDYINLGGDRPYDRNYKYYDNGDLDVIETVEDWDSDYVTTYSYCQKYDPLLRTSDVKLPKYMYQNNFERRFELGQYIVPSEGLLVEAGGWSSVDRFDREKEGHVKAIYFYSPIPGVSTTEPDIDAGLELHPNPVTESLTVSGLDVEGPVVISIYTIAGLLIETIDGNPADAISVAELPAGVYVLAVTDSTGQTMSGQFVKVDK